MKAIEAYKASHESLIKQMKRTSHLKSRSLKWNLENISMQIKAGNFKKITRTHHVEDCIKELKKMGYKVEVDGNWTEISWAHFKIDDIYKNKLVK